MSLALRALAVVADKGIDFQYTIAGGGPEFETLKALAFQLGISESVEFHPGFTGKDYLAKLHSTDVYFLPSYRETMGMTLVEAILAGCYPVVADVSAQGEIVRRVGGTAVKADSIDEMVTRLSDSIIWCHGNRGSLPCLANQAAAKAAREFSSDHYDDVICQAYDKAIAAFNKATKSKA